MQQASAKPRYKTRAAARKLSKIRRPDEPPSLASNILTYVLWGRPPGGRAVNLGELVLKKWHGEVKPSPDANLGMIATAEPYFAVNQPVTPSCWKTFFVPPRSAKSKTSTQLRACRARHLLFLQHQNRKTPSWHRTEDPLELFECAQLHRIAHIALETNIRSHAR